MLGDSAQLCELAHAGQDAHGRKCDDGFGLREAVLVVTGRVVKGDAAGVLVRKPCLGLFVGGVHLNRQGGFNGKNLEEEGEGVAGALRVEEASRLLTHQGIEREGTAVHMSYGGGGRVRAHPQLSLRLLGGGGDAAHEGQCLVRTPGVVLNRII